MQKYNIFEPKGQTLEAKQVTAVYSELVEGACPDPVEGRSSFAVS